MKQATLHLHLTRFDPFSQCLKIPDIVREENERIQAQHVAKKRNYMAAVNPMKSATCDDLLFPSKNQISLAYSGNVHDQTSNVDGVAGSLQPAVFHGNTLDEFQALSVFGKLMCRRLEAKRNIFEASTCLVEAVYKNNSVLAQMFTDALMPLCSTAASVDLNFEALLADAIKRGCSLSIINNVNQLWLKTQKKRNTKH